MRLIDADALIEEYRKIQMASIKMQFVCITEEAIDNAPTIDAVPATIDGALGYLHKVGWIQEHDRIMTEDVAPVRHGHWIEYGENKDGTHNICCSVCDGFFKSKGHANSCYTRNKYRYCHNCGARMDEEADV